MSPLVTGAVRDQVVGYIDAGVAARAELVVDGRGYKVEGHENAFFVGGTLFDRVKPDMTIYTEEIFGPVLGIVRVGSLEEAIELINAHEYRNGTCLFTDGEAARLFTGEIEVGMVGMNVPLPVPVAYHSFGGWKRSCSATCMPTARMGCGSIPVGRPSRNVGPSARAMRLHSSLSPAMAEVAR